MKTLTRTRWFDIEKDGLPIREGLYEVRSRMIQFTKLDSTFGGSLCLWKDGKWQNYDKPFDNPTLKVTILNISGPPSPDYWRGVVRDENYPLDE